MANRIAKRRAALPAQPRRNRVPPRRNERLLCAAARPSVLGRRRQAQRVKRRRPHLGRFIVHGGELVQAPALQLVAVVRGPRHAARPPAGTIQSACERSARSAACRYTETRSTSKLVELWPACCTVSSLPPSAARGGLRTSSNCGSRSARVCRARVASHAVPTPRFWVRAALVDGRATGQRQHDGESVLPRAAVRRRHAALPNVPARRCRARSPGSGRWTGAQPTAPRPALPLPGSARTPRSPEHGGSRHRGAPGRSPVAGRRPKRPTWSARARPRRRRARTAARPWPTSAPAATWYPPAPRRSPPALSAPIPWSRSTIRSARAGVAKSCEM